MLDGMLGLFYFAFSASNIAPKVPSINYTVCVIYNLVQVCKKRPADQAQSVALHIKSFMEPAFKQAVCIHHLAKLRTHDVATSPLYVRLTTS